MSLSTVGFTELEKQNIAVLKGSVVRELFLHTADENYIAARWCAVNRLDTDFLWLSVHALEKYLKAVLLMNGQSSKVNSHSSKRYGHDIVLLYAAAKALAGPLLPDRLQYPDAFTSGWREKTADDFMSHLWENGNADNRYLIYGYTTSSSDLHMLDAMVFAIRRLACPLDEGVTYINGPATPSYTYRERLTASPTWNTRMGLPLDKLIESKEESELRHAALNRNLAFTPDYPHKPVHARGVGRTSVLLMRILDPLTSDDRATAAVGIEMARWLLSNVQMPRGKGSEAGVTEEIENAVKAARSKHNIP